MNTVIFDLEATCWENGPRERMEIIEIGAVKLASKSGPIEGEFASFVRPVASTELSEFCKILTSIRQEDIDKAPQFWEVFPRFVEWCGPQPILCSWGAYDLNQLRADCARHHLEMPFSSLNHVNLKLEFARILKTKSCGMAKALKHLKIPLEGTHHRGIDDARNIAKIALAMWAKKSAP